MLCFLSFAVILSSLCNWKGAQSYKKLPEAIVPKVGHGPKMGQYGFDRACFSVVFLFLLCFIAHLYEANGGRTWKYWPASGPVFFLCDVPLSRKDATKLRFSNSLTYFPDYPGTIFEFPWYLLAVMPFPILKKQWLSFFFHRACFLHGFFTVFGIFPDIFLAYFIP